MSTGNAFWCPECGGTSANLMIRITPARPDVKTQEEVEAFYETDPWAGVLRASVCDRCGYRIPAHLYELWDGMSKEKAQAEWHARYRADAERQDPPRRAGKETVCSIEERFIQYWDLAEAALAQAPEATWTTSLGGDVSSEGENTLAVIVHHVGGNLTSRFTDLLTTDGEKPWRHRDHEFDPVDSATARAAWTRGWTTLFAALDGLADADLTRTVTIRNAPMTVLDALLRALAHVAYHVGQIVLLAKHHAGASWTPLTIPRGQSETYHAQPFVGDAYRG